MRSGSRLSGVSRFVLIGVNGLPEPFFPVSNPNERLTLFYWIAEKQNV